MKGVFCRPLRPEDVRLLDEWRRKYLPADLELPKDFNSEGVKSVASTKNSQTISSLTGVKAIVLDPFIHDDDADPTDLLFSLIKMETILTHWGQEGGAVDSYIAIPRQLKKYARLLENYGYSPTVEGCIVMRRPLLPDFIPLLGPERDAAAAAKAEKERIFSQHAIPDDSNDTPSANVE